MAHAASSCGPQAEDKLVRLYTTGSLFLESKVTVDGGGQAAERENPRPYAE